MESIQKIYNEYRRSSGITTDTRQIRPNSIFIALRGDNFDGNAFAEMALEKGARLAVVDKPDFHQPGCILVDDSLKCLQELARYHRKQISIPVIGLTGTNGKTTTKEIIARVLSEKYITHATKGNLNNHIGVPLSILGIGDEAEIAVIEMGANHQGEIADLCEIALPDRGLITNIGKAHLEGFGGFDGVIKTKTELYDFLRKTNGIAYINDDDPLLVSLAHGMELISYGNHESAFHRGSIAASFPFLEIKWKDHLIRTQLYGDYNFNNIMAAITIGMSFGVSEESIISAIESYKPSNNRSQIINSAGNTIYLDAYNANPSSMQAAISHFEKLDAKNKVVILGDMLELGKDEESEHAAILKSIKGKFDQAILVGPVFAKLANREAFHVFENTKAAAEWLEKHPLKDSNILMKASRGIAVDSLLELL